MFSPYVLENCSCQIQFLCEDLQNIYIYSERQRLWRESNIVGRNKKSITNYAWFAEIGLGTSLFNLSFCKKVWFLRLNPGNRKWKECLQGRNEGQLSEKMGPLLESSHWSDSQYSDSHCSDSHYPDSQYSDR